MEFPDLDLQAATGA